MSNIIDRFNQIAGQEKFKGWPLVGNYEKGDKIPFFGETLKYVLRTGNGDEDYTNIIRSFGWVVVFGVTEGKMVLTLVQWKPGVNCASWELPPGGIGKLAPGASLAEISSKSEEIYLKETGYGEGKWEYLGNSVIESGKYRGAGPDDHGLLAHLYLATGLKKISEARQPNRNEIMETLEVPLDEFRQVLESGLFKETSAVNCALLALVKLGLITWK